MKIVNPIYDHAFKYLMQNERIAKKVLSTLLECEVLELNIDQQEVIEVKTSGGFKLFRLDFSATIVNESGKPQKVLIELQKSKLPTNMLRFRSYLGSSYSKHNKIKNAEGIEEVKAYPIIAIYILGYNVTDIPYLAVSVDNRITNTVTKEEIQVEDDFISLLTHKMRIIQVRRLEEKRKTRLENFLMFFNQKWIGKKDYILELKEEVPEEFKEIAKYLEGPLLDDSFRKQLEAEQEIDAVFKNHETMFAKQAEHLKKMKLLNEKMEKEVKEFEKEKEVAEKEKEVAEKEKEVAEKEKEVAEKEKEVAEKEKEETKNIFAKYLLSEGKSIEEIIKVTGLNREVILSLKSKK